MDASKRDACLADVRRHCRGIGRAVFHVRVWRPLCADIVREFCALANELEARVWLVNDDAVVHILAFAAGLTEPDSLAMLVSTDMALRKTSRMWSNAQWRSVLRLIRPCINVCVCLENAVRHRRGPSLNGVCWGTAASLRPRDDTLVDWGALRRQWRYKEINLVDTRVSVSGRTDVCVRRARGARIQDIVHAAFRDPKVKLLYDMYAVYVNGELLDQARTLEEYGVDDETELCII